MSCYVTALSLLVSFFVFFFSSVAGAQVEVWADAGNCSTVFPAATRAGQSILVRISGSVAINTGLCSLNVQPGTTVTVEGAGDLSSICWGSGPIAKVQPTGHFVLSFVSVFPCGDGQPFITAQIGSSVELVDVGFVRTQGSIILGISLAHLSLQGVTALNCSAFPGLGLLDLRGNSSNPGSSSGLSVSIIDSSFTNTEILVATPDGPGGLLSLTYTSGFGVPLFVNLSSLTVTSLFSMNSMGAFLNVYAVRTDQVKISMSSVLVNSAQLSSNTTYSQGALVYLSIIDSLAPSSVLSLHVNECSTRGVNSLAGGAFMVEGLSSSSSNRTALMEAHFSGLLVQDVTTNSFASLSEGSALLFTTRSVDTNVSIIDSIFSVISASSSGAAISALGLGNTSTIRLTVIGCSFFSVESQRGSGAGISATLYYAYRSRLILDIRNNLFGDCFAEIGGAAYGVLLTGENVGSLMLTAHGNTIESGSSDNGAGSVSLALFGGSYSGLTASFVDEYWSSSTSLSDGAGHFELIIANMVLEENGTCTLSLSSSALHGGVAEDFSGGGLAIYNVAKQPQVGSYVLNIAETRITSSRAQCNGFGGGGGISVFGWPVHVTIERSLLSGNTAYRCSGGSAVSVIVFDPWNSALYVTKVPSTGHIGSLTVVDTIIEGNTFIGSDSLSSYGGAVVLDTVGWLSTETNFSFAALRTTFRDNVVDSPLRIADLLVRGEAITALQWANNTFRVSGFNTIGELPTLRSALIEDVSVYPSWDAFAQFDVGDWYGACEYMTKEALNHLSLECPPSTKLSIRAFDNVTLSAIRMSKGCFFDMFDECEKYSFSLAISCVPVENGVVPSMVKTNTISKRANTSESPVCRFQVYDSSAGLSTPAVLVSTSYVHLPCPYGAICAANGSIVVREGMYMAPWWDESATDTSAKYTISVSFSNEQGAMYIEVGGPTGLTAVSSCPDDICCPREQEGCIVAKDICAGSRTGVLCGSCKQGTSPALFTDDCVPDDSCPSIALIPLVIVGVFVAFAYAALLTWKEPSSASAAGSLLKLFVLFFSVYPLSIDGGSWSTIDLDVAKQFVLAMALLSSGSIYGIAPGVQHSPTNITVNSTQPTLPTIFLCLGKQWNRTSVTLAHLLPSFILLACVSLLLILRLVVTLVRRRASIAVKSKTKKSTRCGCIRTRINSARRSLSSRSLTPIHGQTKDSEQGLLRTESEEALTSEDQAESMNASPVLPMRTKNEGQKKQTSLAFRRVAFYALYRVLLICYSAVLSVALKLSVCRDVVVASSTTSSIPPYVADPSVENTRSLLPLDNVVHGSSSLPLSRGNITGTVNLILESRLFYVGSVACEGSVLVSIARYGAVPVLAFVPIVLIVVLLYLLRKFSKKSQRLRASKHADSVCEKKKTGFAASVLMVLTEGYRDGARWWDSIFYLERLLLGLSFALIREKSLRLATFSFIVALFIGLGATAQPFRHRGLNILSLILHFFLLFSSLATQLATTVGAVSPETVGQLQVSAAMTPVVVGLALVAAVTYRLIRIIVRFCKKRKKTSR